MKNNKAFWVRRSRKILKSRKRRRKCYHVPTYSNKKKRLPNYIHNTLTKESFDYQIVLPKIFSFMEDLSGTVAFYSKTISLLNRCMINSVILIDSNDVEVVSTDAIMYLIAIIRNHKIAKKRHYTFKGNIPKNQNAYRIFTESGFLNFVHSRSRIQLNDEKQAIVSGNKNDSVVAGKFCEFVCNKLNVSKSYTSKLYEVIIEMMSNVVYHAYKNDDEMFAEWYMYAEYADNEIHFLFLDTGLGIPKTVRKHSNYEMIISKLGLANESKLIRSALNGEFRTQTQKDYHGKGMPYIYKFAYEKKIKKFHVISGKGHCWVEHNSAPINCSDMTNRLVGTIYSITLTNIK